MKINDKFSFISHHIKAINNDQTISITIIELNQIYVFILNDLLLLLYFYVSVKEQFHDKGND